jgi:hypothetical protein
MVIFPRPAARSSFAEDPKQRHGADRPNRFGAVTSVQIIGSFLGEFAAYWKKV